MAHDQVQGGHRRGLAAEMSVLPTARDLLDTVHVNLAESPRVRSEEMILTLAAGLATRWARSYEDATG